MGAFIVYHILTLHVNIYITVIVKYVLDLFFIFVPLSYASFTVHINNSQTHYSVTILAGYSYDSLY